MSDVKDTVREDASNEGGDDEAVKLDEGSEEAEGSQEPADTTDYRAELDRLKELDRRKSGALREERELRKAAERKLGERDAEPQESGDIPSVVRQVLNEDRFEEMLEDECPDSSYRELVRYHYESTIRPSGSSRAAIRKDISRCRLLADESKYASEATKRARKSEAEKATYVKASRGMRSVSEDAARKGDYVNVQGESATPQNAEEREMLKAFGLKKE